MLLEEFFNLERLEPCPSCGAPLRVDVFPAQYRALSTSLPTALVVEGESSCFYHPQKKAVIPCQMCGRFLCALCDLELNGRHLCPSCLESGQKKGKIGELQNKRVRYDRMALALATLPALVLWPSLICAPMALYVAIRHWNNPCGVLGKSRAMYMIAAVLASIEIIGWVVFFT